MSRPNTMSFLGDEWDNYIQAETGIVQDGVTITPVPTTDIPGDCSFFDYQYRPATFSKCLQRQIMSVPANAEAAGYSPAVVAASEQMAAAQAAQVPSDLASVQKYYGGVKIPWWLWAAAGGLILVTVLK